MTDIVKYNSPAKVQRIGNDSLYGNGADGNVVIASNTTLARDMYYNNLTINANCHLNTNGYKVFVKGTLTLNGNIGVPSGTTVTTATLKGTAAVASNTTGSLGGNAAGSTYIASQAPAFVLNTLENIILGGYIDTTGSFIGFSGGAGGEDGLPGTVTPAANGTGATAGSAGSSGTLPNRNPGAPGGPGTSGAPGTNGAKGTDVPAAAKGLGATGGAVVIICAKTISGSGFALSQGSNATQGGNSATGSGATNGGGGAPGNSAPASGVNHYTQNHAHYIGGDGTSGPHYSIGTSPSYPLGLPHGGHTAAAQNNTAHGFWCYTTHGATPVHPHNSHYGSNPHQGAAAYNTAAPAPTSQYYHQNSIDHTKNGQLGTTGSVAHTFTHTSGAIFSNYYHETDHHHYVDGKGNHACCTPTSRTRHDLTGAHESGNYRQAGATASMGHRVFPGGSGGAGGLAGTNGTNGSTTAGTNGKSGGGGGIIIVTDSSTPLPISTSVIGGTIGGVSANSGTVITIVNS